MSIPELKKTTEILEVFKKHNISAQQLSTFKEAMKNVMIQVACTMPSAREDLNENELLQEDLSITRDASRFIEDLLVVWES
jgi:hypothetical protein